MSCRNAEDEQHLETSGTDEPLEEMRVGLSEKITNHTLKNILLYPLVWQDVLIFVPRINR